MDDDEKKMIFWFCISVVAIIHRFALHGYFDSILGQESQSYENVIEQTFDVGEHIISVPIDNPKKEVKQYDYHEGYEVIDIENKYILYVNDEPVKCIGYQDSDDEIQFIEFGEPVEKVNKNTESKTYKLVPQEQLTTEE